MGPFWDHNHEYYEYDYQVARYGKLGQKVAGWVDAVEQAMGSGKQGSKPALSAACTAWKALFLPIVYHAFCVIPAAAMVELHWLEKSDSMIRHKNANGVDITVTVGTLARRAKSWSLNAKSKGNNAKVVWDMIRPEVMEPIADGDIAILNCCRYVNEVKGERTVLHSNDKKLCLKTLSYGGWLLSRLMPNILHKPCIIWFRRYLRAHSPQSRRSSRF
jgi:hypothetical protein